MSAALAHRGPDGRGEWEDPSNAIHLAVRRLAILDREMGSQPMRTPDCSLVVAYNGEIYNHVELRRELEAAGAAFRTDHSDTEVLLNAYRQWGPQLTNHLNGMWAFAIYDAARHRLLLSRDRFGQKPLFYSTQNATFAFASELTSLLQHSAVEASVSALSVQKYFAYGFIPAPHSLYSHVFKIPAGCNVVVDTRTLALQISCYWDFVLEPSTGRDDIRSRAKLSEQLRFLLGQAVQRQMRSDVPVGVFLSGGLDSSTIAYFAAAHVPNLETFSIGFDRAGFDESDQARRVASLLGTRHTVKTLTSDDARSTLPRVAARLDEPIGDSSLVCTHALCETARRSVVVTLGGEGADELFGGYDPFRALGLAQWYSRLVPRPIHRAIRLVAARLPSGRGYMPFDYRLTRALRGLSYSRALWNPVWIGPLEPSELSGCFEEAAPIEEVYSEAIDLWDRCPQSSLVERTMQFFVKLYFQDDILTKVDRAGMINSLEVRSPFLDLDLIDFVRRLPMSLKVGRGETKVLFKEAMRPVLPSWVVDRTKHGFAVPMADWLEEGWLEPAAVPLPAGVRQDFVDRKLAAHRKGRANNAVFLWSLWLLTQTTHARTGG